MSASFESNSVKSCSNKEFGETTQGDNSNYIKIQIDNKSLYGRFIKRGVVDQDRLVLLTNSLLDESMNAIQSPSQSQSFIGISIPAFSDHVVIDPDFSVLLDSNSASSNPNSVCKPKQNNSLSATKLSGIIIGSVCFAAVVVASVVYAVKRKKEMIRFTSNLKKIAQNSA
ncbi:hypothetical protein DICPUDRAFT_29106 [Dictyostelium purpureum]|uniref:ComC supersandwich domain-containing protein n=1 Tax=Dictyostelium purpureum TaxID=5786 RepID=F0ZCW7_DICPU|nr:uncharacterized protein DICPUDRAFT_29106 [Dictyostelium purpureum]EGC38209.1 hypothetical protein DICPUDRAFT_29106 [Dictyostelium purpureum]|eukprot:XP_003285247.1 hypothetical protein DICPUDRAFT_29106 [Dictyostelium purpureum]